MEISYPDHEVIGYQEDRSGAIWTCVMTPYMGRTRQVETTNISVVHSAIPLEISEKQIILKFVATTAIVGRNKRIVSVSQRESIQTYRPASPNRVIVLASMKYFDDTGLAKYESETLSHCERHLPFHEQSFIPAAEPFSLVDLRQSLDKFLRSQQLDALIPQRGYLEPPIGFRILVP